MKLSGPWRLRATYPDGRCRIVEGLALLFGDHSEATNYAALCQARGREGCTYDVVPATSRSASRSAS